MYWVNFLHFYQPADQAEEIFDRVVSECYKPFFRFLAENPGVKLSMNINAALTEQLAMRGDKDVLADLSKAAENGQIEFTGSAKYHALLPFLSVDEIKRQVRLNLETNKKYLGESYSPKGFFPPEMAFDPKIMPVLKELGYEWVVLDEIALGGKLGQINKSSMYEDEETGMMVFFRERKPSNLIMSAAARSEADIRFYMQDDYKMKNYMITGMDGETFGHHRPGLQDVLNALLLSREFDHAFFSELPGVFTKREKVKLVPSTWASSQEDIAENSVFMSWKDPVNDIHMLQWRLQELATNVVDRNGVETDSPARLDLDRYLASDQFFWASGKPWWSLEEIEKGAWGLRKVVLEATGSDEEEKKLAEQLYLDILATSFSWQREGKIRAFANDYKNKIRIPLKDKTKDEPWVYDTFVELLRREMKEAADKEKFEEATMWRDAIWKLETKNDIYDAVHVVDLLRKKIREPEILDLMEKYKQDYQKVSSGQPEPRG